MASQATRTKVIVFAAVKVSKLAYKLVIHFCAVFTKHIPIT